jgi:hypothetical protein
MKNLKIVIEPFRIKGNEDDHETLEADILEKVASMVESETLAWHIEEDEDDMDELDF